MDIVTYALCKKLIDEKRPFTPKGEWSETSAYLATEVVSYNGESYAAKTDVPAGTLPTNTEYWLKIASKGATGNGIASIAKTGTSGLVDTYTITYTDGTTSTFAVTNGEPGEVTEEELEEALENKADINGYYIDMTSGQTEQMIATVGNTDNAPYLYRTSGGSADIGNRVQENYIEGGSVVRNQGVEINGTFVNSDNGVASYDATTNIHTFKPATNNKPYLAVSPIAYRLLVNSKYIIGHVYYLNTTILEFSSNVTSFGFGNNAHWQNSSNYGVFASITKAAYLAFQFGASGVANLTTDDYVKITKPQIIDLTQMFGSTIADYLATLPIADALKKLKPWIDTNKYYEYNEGSIESVNLAKKVSVGFNLFDKEGAFYNAYCDGSGRFLANNNTKSIVFRVVPDTNYYINIGDLTVSTAGMLRLSIAKQEINIGNEIYSLFQTRGYSVIESSQIVYIPSGYNYAAFTMYKSSSATISFEEVKNSICINLSHNGSRNGEYKAYETHEYAMPSGELRGMPTLDANNNIVYDGDRFYPDGVTEKRYGIVDLGTLEWTVAADESIFRANLSSVSSNRANMLCARYTAVNKLYSNLDDKEVTGYASGGRVYIRDNTYTDATAFKAAMSGVYLIYELTTPTTSEGTPYQHTQIVDDWGTEEFVPVTGNTMPVGHNSLYPANLRDKVQHLPNLASADGTYAIQQTGSQMTLVPIPEAIPAPPETGTYSLEAVNGVCTWIPVMEEM